MNWKRRATILAILALAQAGIIVCYQGFVTAGPAPAMPSGGEKSSPAAEAAKKDAPKPTDEPPLAPKADSTAIAVPVSPVAPPADEPKKLPDLGNVAMPVVPPLPSGPGGVLPVAPPLPEVVPVAGAPKEPLPQQPGQKPAGLPDVPPVSPQLFGASPAPPPKGADDLSLPSGQYTKHPPQYIPPTPAYPLPKELADLPRAGGTPEPATTPPTRPEAAACSRPPGSATPAAPGAPAPPGPPDKGFVPPPPGEFAPVKPIPQAAPPASKAEVIKDIQCPWVLRVEIVKGRTLMTASTGKEIEFRVSCDKLDLSAPNGRITAGGNVHVSSEGLDGSCEQLTIAWQEDRVVLEGQAELRSKRDGQEMDMKAAKLSLRLSVARAEERLGKRLDTGKVSAEGKDTPTLIRSEPRPPEPEVNDRRAPQVIETRQVGGTKLDD